MEKQIQGYEINRTRLLATLLFYFIGFIMPLLIFPLFVESKTLLMRSNIKQGMLTPLSNYIGDFVKFQDNIFYFLYFKAVFVLSLGIS